ncbi:MAG: hypothetical protein H0T78_12940 [Longispora sp.]|nr:hypothetical protein [Longispora sp. (in: high G+C Gram-positive bacteria)]
MPPLFRGLIDDAAVFPPGNALLPEAIEAHQRYRGAWYASLIGPLLLPVNRIPEARILVADTPMPQEGSSVNLGFPFGAIGGYVPGAVQVELPWTPHLLTEPWLGLVKVYAEVSQAGNWRAALDSMIDTPVLPKFRTGGLSAELFPSITELAAILAACRERGLMVKLTAGLHHAVRYTDPKTGFTHHGFLNILAACLSPDTESDALAVTDAVALAEVIRPHLAKVRPLWVGFGTCSVTEPLADLIDLEIVKE